MKYFVLLTKLDGYEIGDIFNFNAKHALIAQLDFFTQRRLDWEEVTRDAAELNSYFFFIDGKIVNSSSVIRFMH